MRPLIFILIVAGLLPFFHNCGKFASKTETVVINGCEDELLPVFESTYHKFFREDNRCSQCHTLSGIKRDAPFADLNLRLAMTTFLRVGGPEKIKTTLTPNHNGNAYDAHATTLTSHRAAWETAVESCNDNSNTVAIITEQKTPPLLFFEDTIQPGYPGVRVYCTSYTAPSPPSTGCRGAYQAIRWDLSEIVPDVELAIEVSVQKNAFDVPEYYLVRNAKITTPTHKVRLKGLSIQLNGSNYGNLVYSGVDAEFGISSPYVSLIPGASEMVYMKEDTSTVETQYSNLDSWTLKIEKLEIAD